MISLCSSLSFQFRKSITAFGLAMDVMLCFVLQFCVIVLLESSIKFRSFCVFVIMCIKRIKQTE